MGETNAGDGILQWLATHPTSNSFANVLIWATVAAVLVLVMSAWWGKRGGN